MTEERQVLFPGEVHRYAAGRPRYWLTPPKLYDVLDTEFGFDFDPCPFPLPVGFNGLSVDWGRSNFVNPPFRPHDVVNGRGPTQFVRKAIAEAEKGKTSVLILPVRWYTDMLLGANAEIRQLGRVAWEEVETREPMPHPGPCALFVLRGKEGQS